MGEHTALPALTQSGDRNLFQKLNFVVVWQANVAIGTHIKEKVASSERMTSR
jgi:hypothetical protein